MKTNKKKGYTLLEVIIAVGIIAILAVLAGNGLRIYRLNADLIAAVEEGVSLLSNARFQTLASQDASQYGVHFETGRMVFFKGTAFTEPNSDNVEKKLPSTIEISNINLLGGGANIVYERLSGATGQYGNITFRPKADTSKTKRIYILASGLITSDPPGVIPTEGLAGYWRFDEGSGVLAADSSGNGHTGALTNMETGSDWVDGRVGKALEFNGPGETDDYISIAGTPALNVKNDITMSVWVRPSVNSTAFHSSWNFFLYQKDEYKFEFGYYNDDGPRFKPRNEAGTAYDFSPDIVFSAGVWHHVLALRRGSALEIYIDNALADSRNDFVGLLRDGAEVRIGGNGGGSGFLGAIDEVAVWNRALTVDEIDSVYRAGGGI